MKRGSVEAVKRRNPVPIRAGGWEAVSLVVNGTAKVWPPQPAARSADEITSIKLMATGYAGQPGKSS